MKQTIPNLSAGPLWVVGLLGVGAALLAVAPSIPGRWLLPAVLVGGAGVWHLLGRGTAGQSGSVDAGAAEESDALETLKAQYAVGEIGEAEFERRVETLLETDSAADGRDRVDAEPASAAVDAGGVDADRQSPDPAARAQPDRRGRGSSGRHGCRRRRTGRHGH